MNNPPLALYSLFPRILCGSGFARGCRTNRIGVIIARAVPMLQMQSNICKYDCNSPSARNNWPSRLCRAQ
eukprot:2348102-Amphidinium_carterae.1